MTMGMNLLTYRLTDYMNQAAANQMEEIVRKEKIRNETLLTQDQSAWMSAKNKIDLLRIEQKNRSK
jgi:hypothetical protein